MHFTLKSDIILLLSVISVTAEKTEIPSQAYPHQKNTIYSVKMNSIKIKNCCMSIVSAFYSTN